MMQICLLFDILCWFAFQCANAFLMFDREGNTHTHTHTHTQTTCTNRYWWSKGAAALLDLILFHLCLCVCLFVFVVLVCCWLIVVRLFVCLCLSLSSSAPPHQPMYSSPVMVRLLMFVWRLVFVTLFVFVFVFISPSNPSCVGLCVSANIRHRFLSASLLKPLARARQRLVPD